jgi:uncharacterized protein (DUF924 family)
MSSASVDEILNFWFGELSRKDWFRKDEALDSTIASRFGVGTPMASRKSSTADEFAALLGILANDGEPHQGHVLRPFGGAAQ